MKLRLLARPLFFLTTLNFSVLAQTSPENIQFIRQGVRRLIFDPSQCIPLAALKPAEIVGMSAMYPVEQALEKPATVEAGNNLLTIHSEQETQTSIWFGGFNPFATYTLDLTSTHGEGEVGFEYSAPVEKSLPLPTLT